MGNPKRSVAAFSSGVEENHPQFVTALARGLSILRCFERGERYLGNQDIAARTGLPKPTISRLTFTLASLGYLEYSPSLEKYSLGVNVLALGHAFKKDNDIVAASHPLMEELAQYTKSAVMLATTNRSHMVLLDICQGDPTFRLQLEAGSLVPHSSTALGRAYLAARPVAAVERYLESLRKGCSPSKWPKIKAGIVRARADYEQYGFCFSMGDWNSDVFAVGVPIVSADRSRIFAFNCSGRISMVTREKLIKDFGPKLVALRNKVYEITGGRF
jgi:DNA-binding IclR family transcriptional regulator